MLKDLQSARERWGGVSEVIDRWLKERQELLVRYCDVSDNPTAADAGQKLQSTCQILVDYVSAGHFEVYDKLIKEGRDFEDDEGLKTGEALYHSIDLTTEKILDFNDKYLETDDLTSLPEDLSELGVSLANRFEAEDQMIEVLHNAHKTLLA